MTEKKRKLAAILSADVVGYSRLMQDNEAATVDTLNEYRSAIGRVIAQHNGRIVNAPGDNILAEFPSAVEAVNAAVKIQGDVEGRNAELAVGRRMQLRVGINLGDVIEEGDGTIYGDGVNIAARMEALAETGGICLSATVHEHVKGKVDVDFKDLGLRDIKNIAEPVRAYRLQTKGSAATTEAESDAPFLTKRSGFVLIGTAAAVLLAFGGFAVWQMTRAPVAEISAETSDADMAEAGTNPVESTVQVLPSRPSIAVLPFDNLSPDSEQDYFVDGLTEEIIGTLARFSDLAVIARNSSFRYKEQSVDVRAVGKELGAQYLVEGSVRRATDTIRVTAQLIETKTGSHLWAENYERALTAENVFGIQDEIATAVAVELAGRYGVLRQVGLASAKRKPPSHLSSYDCVLLAMEHSRTASAETHKKAKQCLENAVRVDSDYATAWYNLAHLYIDDFSLGYDPREDSLDRALRAAQRGVELDPDDALMHWAVARTHFMRGDLDGFNAEVERVIEGTSKGIVIPGALGVFVAYSGDWAKGLEIAKRAAEQNPYHSIYYSFGAYFDYYRNREYEAALAAAQMVDQPQYVWANALFAAAYGQMDKPDQARPYVDRILQLDPDFEETARANRWKWFRYQEDLLDHFMDGLRKAGLNIRDEEG